MLVFFIPFLVNDSSSVNMFRLHIHYTSQYFFQPTNANVPTKLRKHMKKSYEKADKRISV